MNALAQAIRRRGLGIVLVLVCLLRTSAWHPCRLTARRLKYSFSSTCNRERFLHQDVVVYACLLVQTERIERLPQDALATVYGADSLVGRIWPVDGGGLPLNESQAEETRPLIPEAATPVRVPGADGAVFDCAATVATHLPAGSYRFDVRVEYRDFEWEPLWNFSTELGSFGGLLGNATTHLFNDHSLQTVGGTLVVEAPLPQAPALLPPCRLDMSGVWKGGRFVPTHCIITDVSYDAFEGCIAALGGTLIWRGDSNSRRASKSILSRGVWCSAASEQGEAAPYCGCEDCDHSCADNCYIEKGMPWGASWGAFASQSGNFGGVSILIHRSGQFPSSISERESPGALHTLLHAAPSARVLVVGETGAWPEAGANLTDFVTGLQALAAELRTLPPDMTLIFKTGPYFCCTSAAIASHRFTHKRQAVQVSLFKQTMMTLFPDALWWRVPVYVARTFA